MKQLKEVLYRDYKMSIIEKVLLFPLAASLLARLFYSVFILTIKNR